MAVSFKLPSVRPLDLVRFSWSPLAEAALSLQAVNNPKQTPMHLPWARRCRELPADLLEEIYALTGSFNNCVPGIFEVGLGGRNFSFEDEIDALRQIDDDLIASELSIILGGMSCGYGATAEGVRTELVHDDTYRTQVLAAAERDEGRLTLLRSVFDDPAAIRDRYATMHERYWEEAFADEWARLRPRIESEVADGARALVTEGVPGLLDELLPEGRWDEDSLSIVIDKEWDGGCDIAERGGLHFVPTWYGWPRVMIELSPPWPVLVFHPLREMRHPAVPTASDAEVADGFRAIGDETRLQIARMVAETPRSTKELAELLSLSDSAISRHLKILEAAGMVQSRRDGYFVLYSLNPGRLDILGGALRSTLGLARSSSGDTVALPVSMPRSDALASVGT